MTANWLPGLNDGETAASPAPMGDSVQSVAGRLTFQSFRDGNWEIYGGSDDASASAGRLTADPSSDIEPRLSPDTRQIVFTSKRSGNYDIWLMNADGSGLRQLTNDPATDSAPAWSPDGTRIAFTSSRGNNTDVYVLTVNGGALTRLTTQTDYDGEPAWSPDGTQIAFISKRSSGIYDFFLYTMAADGSGQTLRSAVPYATRPNWSTDGRQILFDGLNSDGWQRLYLYSASNSGTQALNPSGIVAANYEVWAGSWGQGTQAYATLVSYILYQGTWYIESMTLLSVNTVAGAASGLYGTQRDGMPDWRSADTLPPVSALAPTNPYVLATVTGIGLSGTAIDQGIAGVDRIETQYRFANGDWQTSSLSCFLTLPSFGCTGMWPMQDVQIRARAVDRMGNVEAWPTDPNQWVTLRRYRLRIDGAVTDLRGAPLANVPITGAPSLDPNPTTGTDGRYRLYVPDLTAPIVFTMTASLPGVAPDPRAYALEKLIYGYGTSQTVENFRLLPDDQVFDDPGFDGSSGSWTTSGQWPLQWLPARPYPTELSRVRLGGSDGVRTMVSGVFGPIIATQDNTVAMVYHGAYQSSDAVFQLCSLSGTCGPIERPGGIAMALGMASDGTVALLSRNASMVLEFRTRTPAGTWSAPHAFATQNGDGFTLLADLTGGWHSIWIEAGEVMLSHRNVDGTWTPPVSTGNGLSPRSLFDAAGRLHLLRCLPSGVVEYTWTPVEGVLGPLSISAESCDAVGLSGAMLAADGQMYVTWLAGNEIHGVRRSAAGVWSAMPPFVDAEALHVSLSAPFSGPGGRPTLVGTDNSQGWGGPLTLIEWTQAGNWLAMPLGLKDPGPDLWQSYFGWNPVAGRLLVVRESPYMSYSDLVGELSLESGGEPSALSQTVTLNPSLHRPTLSLLYRQEDPAATLTVHVQAAGGTPGAITQVLPAGVGWQRGWVDLTAFAGRTLMITISLQGPAGTWPQADFDEIVLGSWNTPLVSSISPDVLDAPSGAVTLVGDNFMGTPTVTIGGLPASVNVVDEQHLSVTLPAGLGYGRHAVIVTNPDGFATTSPQPVQAGHDLLFIPTLLRLIPGGWTTYFP